MTQPLQLIGNSTQAQRVSAITQVRPDVPRHKPEIVCKGYFAANGSAFPAFSQVLSDVNDVALHVKQHAGAKPLCIGLLSTEILNPLVTEKITSARD